MSFNYQHVADILRTDTWNESEKASQRNFHTDEYLGPDIISELLKNGYCITSVETENYGGSNYDSRVWVSTHDEVLDRWDVMISTGYAEEESDGLENQIEQEAEELVEEIEAHDNTYECNDCGNRFAVKNVTEYEGCPNCRSRDTDRL